MRLPLHPIDSAPTAECWEITIQPNTSNKRGYSLVAQHRIPWNLQHVTAHADTQCCLPTRGHGGGCTVQASPRLTAAPRGEVQDGDPDC